MSSFFFSPCRCTSSTQALKNCEETSSRGSDRTGIARLKEEVERKKERKKEKESEENRENQAFRPIMERLLGKGLEHSEGTSSIAQ